MPSPPQKKYNSGTVHIFLTLKVSKKKKKKIVEFANSVDPFEVAHNEPPHLDLRYLRWLIRSHLIWIFAVCSLSLDPGYDIAGTIFHYFNFADINLSSAF